MVANAVDEVNETVVTIKFEDSKANQNEHGSYSILWAGIDNSSSKSFYSKEDLAWCCKQHFIHYVKKTADIFITHQLHYVCFNICKPA